MIIYCITNKINGKKYIGQTITTLKRRWQGHCSTRKGCVVLQRAMQKYGKDNFEIKVLSRCNSREEMDHRETYYIELFNTLSPNGYNARTGGHTGYIYTEEVRVKMGINSRGKICTEAHRQKISDANKGVPVPEYRKKVISQTMMGVKHTEERKANQKKAWQTRPDFYEFKEKLRQAGKRNSIRIICDQTGIIYESVREAARQLSLFPQHIRQVLKGRQKYTKGYTFRKVA